MTGVAELPIPATHSRSRCLSSKGNVHCHRTTESFIEFQPESIEFLADCNPPSPRTRNGLEARATSMVQRQPAGLSEEMEEINRVSVDAPAELGPSNAPGTTREGMGERAPRIRKPQSSVSAFPNSSRRDAEAPMFFSFCVHVSRPTFPSGLNEIIW